MSTNSLYYETLTSLLLTIPGIGGVVIDDENNQITISTIPDDFRLNGQRIIVELKFGLILQPVVALK